MGRILVMKNMATTQYSDFQLTILSLLLVKLQLVSSV